MTFSTERKNKVKPCQTDPEFQLHEHFEARETSRLFVHVSTVVQLVQGLRRTFQMQSRARDHCSALYIYALDSRFTRPSQINMTKNGHIEIVC